MQLPLGLIQNFSLTGLIKISSKHHLSFLLCNFSPSEGKVCAHYLLHVYSAFVSIERSVAPLTIHRFSIGTLIESNLEWLICAFG